MISRIWSKVQTQAAIKALRAAGLTVTKLNGGYECYRGEILLFKAMIGTQAYLVRLQPNLFE
jgi:predicted ABC-type sugar transport system permease subunit